MKLSDVMSSMNLAAYAEIGLVLFLAAFLGVVFEILRRGKALEELASLPLESTSKAAPSSNEAQNERL